MKKIFILFVFATTLFGCDKDDKPQPTNLVDQLPPPTQTGENTFGCILDGQVFKPDNGSDSLGCFYQLVEGEYYFSLHAFRDINNTFIALGIGAIKKQIFQGQTYILDSKIDGNTFGIYNFGINFYNTNSTHRGELYVTKLDTINQIVSGTFWYDVIDSNGVIHKIRDGRFDVNFTI
jgi:hypothetical protein